MVELSGLLDKIRHARVYEAASRTSLDLMTLMSARLSNDIWLKREDEQSVFSFKIRGAYNRIAHLTDAQIQRGIICASAGNHAQGVAIAAARLGIEPLVIMPKTTPDIKIEAVKRSGATVQLYGNTYDEASAHALLLAQERDLVFIHPYNDEYVMAGQGTIGAEIIEAMEKKPDAIFVPVGGGGLIAGIGTYCKASSPDTRIIGVEPVDASCLYSALAACKRVMLDRVGIFADGVAVRQVGELTFDVAQQVVDEVLLVSTDEICAAIKDIYDDTRSIAEPAGALGLAGLKQYVAHHDIRSQQLVTIFSGANINFDRLRHVAERAEMGENRESLLAVTIPEKPGSFREFCHVLGARSITEFNYRYAHDHDAQVFAGIELKGNHDEKQKVLESLRDRGYQVLDLSDNELAKLHIRYMVGGYAQGLQEEVVYRFEFPERPGALLRFLTHLGGKWNISLFHYRNHGSDYGRVLAGFQVPVNERNAFQSFLDELGYIYTQETDNPVYQLFLGSDRLS